MLFNTAFLSLASLALVAIDAAPTIAPRAEPGLISADCIDVSIRGSWLVGSCLTGEGTTRVQSSVYLSSKITNTEGTISVRPQDQNSTHSRAKSNHSGKLLVDTVPHAKTARLLTAHR